jgi:hypothetical protein
MHLPSRFCHVLHALTLLAPTAVFAASVDQVINASPPSPVSDICGKIVEANLYSGGLQILARETATYFTTLR